MSMGFSQYLLHFANSADVLTEEAYFRFLDIVENYAHRTLGIDVTHVLIESMQKRALTINSLENSRGGVVRIRDKRSYYGQAGYAYDQDKPLWVLNKTPGNALKGEGVEYKDLWSGVENLPPYRMPRESEVEAHTAILIPLKLRGETPFGVLNLETTERIEITKRAKDELKRIADAVALCYMAYRHFKGSAGRTSIALGDLMAESTKPWPRLTKPRVFFAFPADCDDQVVRLVTDVVKNGEFGPDDDKSRFKDYVQLEKWNEINQPGNINQYLLDVLSTCKYGICYFFEQRDKDEKPREAARGTIVDRSTEARSEKDYFYNLNVVFEAGMLYVRTHESTTHKASWIPIREKTGEAPFDLAAERAVIVHRNENGDVDESTFREDLTKRLQELVLD